MHLRKNPLVSVIVPMYNVGPYIRACIESVLAQTFHNFEVICVNDGCTDDTLTRLAQYRDRRIHIIHQSNAGLSAARNTGIFAARGLYVAFLDSDDVWDKRKLTMHVRHLSSNPKVAVSYCASKFINEQGELMGIGQYPKLTNISIRDVMCRNPVGNGSAPVIRRSTLTRHIRFNPNTNKREVFNESLRQSEDIELWLRIAMAQPDGFEGIPEALTLYRINQNGLSANTQKQYQAWHRAVWDIARQSRKTRLLFGLAKAYQLRYLARRAIQSCDRWIAISLVHRALFCNPLILFQEPGRTMSTYICALLRLLPVSLYRILERTAQETLEKRMKSLP